MLQPQILSTTHLADQLERGFRGGAWHGPALMEILAGVGATTAHGRPAPQLHSIAELVGHLSYWLADTRRRIQGEARLQEGPAADWGSSGQDSAASWQAACASLEEAHGLLMASVRPLTEARLDEVSSDSDTTLRGLLLGTLQHLAYHAGQIAQLRKLLEPQDGRMP